MAKHKTLPVEEVYSRAVTYERKSMVQDMVARKAWGWVIPGKLAKRLPLSALPLRSEAVRCEMPPQRYTGPLPPFELPDIKFKAPEAFLRMQAQHKDWLRMVSV